MGPNGEVEMTGPRRRPLSWYVATIILKARIGDRVERPVTCFEQVHLIRAPDSEAAYEKALRLGRAEEHAYLNCDGETVCWEFVGLENLESLLDDAIRDGTEIRSRRLEVDDPNALVRAKQRLIVFRAEEWRDKTAAEILAEDEDVESGSPPHPPGEPA